MVARAAFVLVLLAAALPATATAATPRIVGGTTASTAELPYAAGLEIALQGVGGDEPDALCGGTLIAARWVVTAAHCLVEEPIDPAHSYVVLGATDLDTATPDQIYGFADGGVPKAYTGSGGYDVGLVQLSRPAPEQQVRLARPSDSALLAGGTPALTAGWGLTEDKDDGGTLSTNQLRMVGLNLYSDTDCANAFAAVGQSASGLDFSTEICALAPNKDSCNGDSGGPLIVADGSGQPTLIGAVSFGIGNGDTARGSRSCNEGPPGVYAKIGANPLNAFIRSVVPQVEIDSNVKVPVPGETVTLTAAPNAPGGTGRFGGYDALAWDLNGDGTFAEELDKRVVSVPAAAGATTVSVRATTTAGDAEVRTLRLISQNKSALAFAKRSAKVRRGRTVRLKVNRIGAGAGTVKVTVSGHGVSATPKTLTISGAEPSVTVRLHARRGASRKVSVRLTSFAGDVIAGTHPRLTLKTRR